MWACLKDQDTSGQWKQVAGWRKVCDLTLAHLSRLQEYRRGLAEAWPPETNEAARAYIAELDQLIDKVQRTHDAAAANYDALAAATRAIGSTRAELKPIYDEYAAKLQQKQAYEATLADPKAVAGSRLPEQPPVTDADLERLNVRARGLMTGLSGELQQAQVMLRQPPTKGNARRQPDEQSFNGDTISVPVIPPIVPVPIAGGVPTAHKNGAPVRPVPAATSSSVVPAPQSGPTLGGTGNSPAPAPVIPGHPSVTPPPSMSGQPLGANIPLPTHGLTRREASNAVGDRARPPGKPAHGRVDGLSPMPTRPSAPGGLIGANPGMGLNHPNSKAHQTRQVNPIGGVIGGGGGGTAPSGAAGPRPGSGRISQLGSLNGMSPIGGVPGVGPRTWPGDIHGRPGHPNSHGEPRRWDSDDPWRIDEGVAPIMRPPHDEGPIDPGPAIGLNR